MEQIWKDMLTEHDKKCLANQSSFQPRRGLGSKPALIVIDMQKAVIGDDMPIYEQQDRYPYACGNFAWAAIRHIEKLIPYCREHGIPVAHACDPRRHRRGKAGAQRVLLHERKQLPAQQRR